jgi:hypothetical protein
MSDIVERLSDILDAIEHGVVTITAHDVATIATARAEIIELRERMQLHEAYREVAEAAAMEHELLHYTCPAESEMDLYRRELLDAGVNRFSAVNKHAAAIRAAMDDNQEKL